PSPVAASTTTFPAIGLPLASRAVTVIVALPPPAASVVGTASTLDCPADTAPTVTDTVAAHVTTTPSMPAHTVLASAAVERSVPAATPWLLLSLPDALPILPSPVAASTTTFPAIGLPLASRAVTVIVALPPPAASVVGTASTLDCPADTAPTVT